MQIARKISDLAAKVVRSFDRTKKTESFKSNSLQLPTKQAARNFLNRTPTLNQIGRRRIVLIDGTDVATSYSNNTSFSVAGLEICLNKLRTDNETYAIVPQFRLKQMYSSNNRRLQALEKQRQVIITPGKTLNNTIHTCNPNPILLDIAKEFGAAIVSNSDFHVESNLDPDFDAIIRSRRVAYRWVNQDIEFRPADPSGTLEQILGQQ